MLTQFTAAFSAEGINIDNFVNKSRGEYAYSIVDAAAASVAVIEKLNAIDGVLKVRVVK